MYRPQKKEYAKKANESVSFSFIANLLLGSAHVTVIVQRRQFLRDVTAICHELQSGSLSEEPASKGTLSLLSVEQHELVIDEVQRLYTLTQDSQKDHADAQRQQSIDVLCSVFQSLL